MPPTVSQFAFFLRPALANEFAAQTTEKGYACSVVGITFKLSTLLIRKPSQFLGKALCPGQDSNLHTLSGSTTSK
jgi:hypothetical protein